MKLYWLELIYLLGSVSFIAGLKLMGNPKTARKGNLIGAAGMTLAIIGTIVFQNNYNPVILSLIFVAIALGTLVGLRTANSVPMTKMPELVSLFNGMGGACAALISLIEFYHMQHNDLQHISAGTYIAILGGMIIGSVSFSGSIIAFLKLNGSMKKPIRLPSYNVINNIILLATLAMAVIFTLGNANMPFLLAIFAIALLYGIMFTVPIGGADMPVVISLLNSFTGVAAAFGGFLYDNKIMLIGGILVGSAGTLLTFAMCKAMNRPLSNVIFGSFGDTGEAGGSETKGSIKDITASDLAVMLAYSKKVVIVPGYGLAVAQAQHAVKELEDLLEEKGVEVKYAIHPVAGRMPGHMNVLLAEANVSYDKLVEMEEINPEFEQTDVVLVIGANDVVNPAAKTDPSSPIYGMPILEVDKAKHIIVNKRSMNAGYAGIDNLLFYNPKTYMYFGDAKKALMDLIAEIKQL